MSEFRVNESPLGVIRNDYSAFAVGKIVEILNIENPKEMFVARIKEQSDRRLRVLIEDLGQAHLLSRNPNHDQADPEISFWVNVDSFLIFPVGFAMVNGIMLRADQKYEARTRKIAMSIRNNRNPRYHPSDVRFESFGIKMRSNELRKHFVVGQKFEFLNPFLPLSKTLRCATIVHICETDGYVMVAQDDDENFDEIPVGGRLDVFFENQKILTASIASVHGTIVKVNFEGWDQENGTLYDTDSTELLPVGWAKNHDITIVNC
uniref:DUF3127 domain-containing protein n=1 Tax=Caenorhabditis tropicalis TaxID=1561998 RepID=A0A1I7TSU2_9PELO